MSKQKRLQAVEPPSVDPNIIIRQQIVNRFWRTLNYLSITAMYIAVYCGALLAEWLVGLLIGLTQPSPPVLSPRVAQAVYFLQVGTYVLLPFGAFLHTCFALYSQWQLEMDLIREGKKT